MPSPTGDEAGTEASLPPPLPFEVARPGANFQAGPMSLGKELLGWAACALILLVWWRSEWTLNGGSSSAASSSGAFRNYIANSMLVHDEFTKNGYQGPGFIRWLMQLETIPDDVFEAFAALDQEGLMTDSLQLDLALVSLRFSQDQTEDSADWKQMAQEALSSVSTEGQKETYFRIVKSAVEGAPLPEADRDSLSTIISNPPITWWSGFLADHYQMKALDVEDHVRKAREDALGSIHFTAILIVDLTLLGLLALPAAWGLLSRPRPELPTSHQRLFRIWRGPRVVATFALAALLALWLNHYFFLSIYPSAAQVTALLMDPYTAWQTNTWLWLGWATTMAALPMFPLCRTYGTRFPRLAGVFGFRNRDFPFLPYLALGVAAMGLLPWLFHYLDAGLAYLGSASSVLDGLSRSFSDQGELALPLGLFWSVIMAPFVEEIIFRGFIFRSIQARWGTLIGMLISSFVFAGSHFYSINGTIHVFLYGLLFCWVYQRTGKLAASMFVHAGSNLAVTLLAHFSGG